MDSLLLRPSEAADALGISRSALYELMGVGVLRGVKIGASRRIPRDELESFVSQLRLEAADGLDV